MLKNVTFATFVLFSFYVHGSAEAEKQRSEEAKKQSFIRNNTHNTVSACLLSNDFRNKNAKIIQDQVNKAPTPELMADVEAQRDCTKEFLLNLVKMAESLRKLTELEENIIKRHNLRFLGTNQDELTEYLAKLKADLADMSQNQ